MSSAKNPITTNEFNDKLFGSFPDSQYILMSGGDPKEVAPTDMYMDGTTLNLSSMVVGGTPANYTDTLVFNSGDVVVVEHGLVTGFSNCFPGETLVSTPSGEKPISEIIAGQFVTSINPFGEPVYSKVEKISIHENNTDLLQILFEYKMSSGQMINNHGVLLATAEHPIWTNELGFAKALEMKKGMTLRLIGGIASTIADIKPIRKESHKVYNLTLTRNSSRVYFAGMIAGALVLVHNK